MATTLADEKKSSIAFGSRLRALRLAAELTQQQLAERVGMLYQNIARLERGDRNPTWDTVLKLAEALNVEPNDFLSDEPTDPPSDDKPAAPKKPRKK